MFKKKFLQTHPNFFFISSSFIIQMKSNSNFSCKWTKAIFYFTIEKKKHRIVPLRMFTSNTIIETWFQSYFYDEKGFVQIKFFFSSWKLNPIDSKTFANRFEFKRKLSFYDLSNLLEMKSRRMVLQWMIKVN